MSIPMAVSRVVAEAFVAGLWQGFVLVGMVALALRMVPRLGAAARFAVWGLAFVAAVVVPLVRFSGNGGSASGGGIRVGLGWGFAVAASWGLLMVIRLARLVGEGLRLRRIWKEAVPFAVAAGISELLGEMPRRPVLCVSGSVDAPSVIGFRSPKLLIPDWQVEKLNEGEMRQIVLHECEHLRRGDDWVNLAQKIGLALFPLNPALLWVDRRLSLERELACDAGVVARTRRPFDYAECLTRLAEQRLGRSSLGLALSAWGRESELVRRVHRLLRPVGSMGRGWMRVSVWVMAVAVGGGSLELARAPRLVLFGDGVAVQMAAGSADVVEHVPASAAGRMMPVVYREPVRMERAGEKARVLGGKGVRSARRRRQVAGLSKQAAAKRGMVVLPAKAGWMLTSAEVGAGEMEVLPVEPVGVRVVNAVQMGRPESYAAVPFANGWLILQL